MSEQSPTPTATEEPPGPGYWKAADGNWYPPQPPTGAPAPTKQKKKRRWPWIIGIIIVVAVIAGAMSGGSDEEGITAADTDEGSAETAVADPGSEAPADAVDEGVDAELDVTEPVSQTSAARSAQSYIDLSGFSRSGLIEQLKFEGYSQEDAEHGVDSLNADWNEQAARSAQSYIDLSGFSRTGLIEQLEFEGYTTTEAESGVDSLTIDWNEQAARSAQSYLDLSGFSRSGLIDQLTFEGYTQEQAEFGVTQVGL